MADLINYLHENHNMCKYEAEDAIKKVTKAIRELVCAGETVYIAEFGQFMPILKSERHGRDIAAGKPVIIPARWEPFFKPEKRFKEAVRELEGK